MITVVNQPPVAADDGGPLFTTDEDTPFTTGNVLDNDSDPDGDPLSVSGYDDSALLGTLTDNGDGTFAYDPDGQFDYLALGEQATDTFVYTVSDGALTDTATVSITLAGVRTPGVALTPDRSAIAVPGAVVTYTHTLTNTGDSPDAFDISHASSQGWAVTYETPIALGAGEAATLVVSVTVPAEAISGTVDSTVITATSQADAGVSAAVTDTTNVVVGRWEVYLPIVLRNP